MRCARLSLIAAVLVGGRVGPGTASAGEAVSLDSREGTGNGDARHHDRDVDHADIPIDTRLVDVPSIMNPQSRYFCMYQGFLGSARCADFRPSGDGGKGSCNTDVGRVREQGGTLGDTAVAKTVGECLSSATPPPRSRIGSFLTDDRDTRGVELHCWTCGGYNDLLYTLKESECLRAVEALRHVYPTQLSCRAATLYGHDAYLLAFPGGCSPGLVDALEAMLPLTARGGECSGHGVVVATTEGGRCKCRAGFIGCDCETSVFDI